MKQVKKASVTVLLPAGRLPLEIMSVAYGLAEQYGLQVYLSTLQNLRITGVAENDVDTVKTSLAAAGAEFKGPGKFPIPRVCVGKDHCNLAIIDTEKFSHKILDHFSGREHTKAKFKIAVAGCTLCCSGVKTTDIGIMATRDGFEIFTGGKGGPFPKIGRRIARNLSDEAVLETIETLVDLHDQKTEKKQRMFKLLDNVDFPYPEM